MAKPFRLGITMKLWGRPAVAEFCMRHLRGLRLPGVETVCVAVASPGDLHEPGQVEGWERVYAPNGPLTPKGNRAVKAMEGRVDAVLNVGSDDIVSVGYLRAAIDAIRRGAEYVVPEGLVIYDLATGRVLEVDAPRIGAGRVIGASLLERLHWHPWPMRGRMPDADMDKRFLDFVPEAIYNAVRVNGADVAAGMVVCDVKCGDNIGSFDEIDSRRSPKGQTRRVTEPALCHALGIAADEVIELRRRHIGFRYDNNLDSMNPEVMGPTQQRPIRMRALRTFRNDQNEGTVRRTTVFYASEGRAKDLERAKAAVREDEPKTQKVAVKEEKAVRVTKEEKTTSKRTTKEASAPPKSGGSKSKAKKEDAPAAA